MLDKFIDPKLLRTRPLYAIPTGLFFVILGFVSSMLVFSSQISVVMIAFSSLLILPYIIKIFEFDELDVDIDDTNSGELEAWVRKCLRDGFSPKQIKDSLIKDNMDKPYDLLYDLTGVDEEYLNYVKASNVFTRHIKTIQFYVYLFLGMFLAYAILYSVLPADLSVSVFENQLDIMKPGPAGFFGKAELLGGIIKNNLVITLVCVFLSLLYGSGAIFILNYNASIAGVLYGSSMRALLGGGVGFLANPYAFVPHTVVEILAYLFAAISGGIISKAASSVLPGSARILVRDGLIYLAFSVVLILIAGVVEVTVPFMFT